MPKAYTPIKSTKMITSLRLQNWKSFKDSTIYIDPLTFLIGTNASGKSNVLDAFLFLHLLMKGQTLEDAANAIRGGSDWIIRQGETWFQLTVTIEQGSLLYDYTIKVEKDGIGLRSDEDIYVSKRDGMKATFLGENRTLDPSTLIHVNIAEGVGDVSFKDIISTVKRSLRGIFILTPDPQEMRKYTKLSRELKMNAGNIAGVLAALDTESKEKIEEQLTSYVRPLPERDIQRVTAVKVGLSQSDAMLYCYEDWNPDKPIDARGMSDGTLRFIAIIAAMLTLPSHSLLIIEEVDNGLHPSRSNELIKVLKEISSQREIDVLCTTHNPVLIDELGNEMIPFISFVKRDPAGCSNILLLEEKANLAKLMASGSIGDMMTEDTL